MMKPATKVSIKFRKEVEQVSQDKVRGPLVQYFRTLFTPDAIYDWRTRDSSAALTSATGTSKSKARKQAKKKKKKQKAKKKAKRAA